jgi:mannosyl-3-phosphoglycerate phosphatase
MLKKYNYYALHYHMKKCGTRTVIENILSISKKSNNKFSLIESGKQAKYTPSKNIEHIKIPDIDYNNQKFSSYKELEKKAKDVAKEIEKNLDLRHKCIIHSHNLNLFKNSYTALALKILADKYKNKIIILMQIHDFAEDSRPKQLNLMLNATKKKNKEIANKLAYPQGSNIFYLTINSRDKKLLNKIGILKEKIFLFANAMDIKSFEKNPIKNNLILKEIEKYSKKENYYFDIKRKNIIYPVKILKRKNIIESILILKLLNSIKDEYQLLITLDSNSKEDELYSEKIKDFVRKEKLPVVIGFGWELINPSGRKIKDKQVKEFILADLFYNAKSIITTSKLEGFGFTFLEGWLMNKEVVGRKIEFVQKDFEKEGIKFPGFYNKININGVDYKDLSINKQFEIIRNYKKYNILKQEQLQNTINEIIKPSKKIILQNKKIIKKVYSLKNYYKTLSNIIDKCDKISKNKENKINEINNDFLIKYFKTKKEKKIIITDLDGTMINDNYDFSKLKNIIKKIKSKKIPICFCTSKSYEELKILNKKINNKDPFILENGAGIFIPKNYFSFKINKKNLQGFNYRKIKRTKEYDIIELNVTHKETLKVMKKIQKKLDFEVKIYSELSAREINKITNLPSKIAELSRIKSYADGFFVKNLNDKKEDQIKNLAKKYGFNARAGGRFIGLNKGGDKGTSTKILLYLFEKEYYKIKSFGLGDSENDFAMLKEVDKPILIKRKGKDIRKKAIKKINKIEFINDFAPSAWEKGISENLSL